MGITKRSDNLDSSRPISNGVKCPHAVIFDLDNTLAESFQSPQPHVASRLHQLLDLMPVAIMSGASFSRMEEHLLPSLPEDVHKGRLYLFPDTAAQCYLFHEGEWRSVYKNDFTKKEFDKIINVFTDALAETRIIEGAPRWGELFLARDVQVTFAALGIDASPTEKAAWDPDRTKREQLKRFLEPRLPGFDIRISGRTAIDITRTGIDKAHGVRWFAARLKVEPHDMLFVGDDLEAGGNDAVVIPTGIQTIQVAGPHQTADVIDSILAACAVTK